MDLGTWHIPRRGAWPPEHILHLGEQPGEAADAPVGGVPSGRRVLPGRGPVRKGVQGQQGQHLGVVGQEPARQVDDPLVLLVGLGARRGGGLGRSPWEGTGCPQDQATSLSPVVGRNLRAGMLSAPSHPPVGRSLPQAAVLGVTAVWSVAARGPTPHCFGLRSPQRGCSFCYHPSAR